MGHNFSTELSETEFQKQIKSLGETDLSPEHSEELSTFLMLSHDFTNFFTSVALNDFRELRKRKPFNLIYLMSHVSHFRKQTSPFGRLHHRMLTSLSLLLTGYQDHE